MTWYDGNESEVGQLRMRERERERERTHLPSLATKTSSDDFFKVKTMVRDASALSPFLLYVDVH